MGEETRVEAAASSLLLVSLPHPPTSSHTERAPTRSPPTTRCYKSEEKQRKPPSFANSLANRRSPNTDTEQIFTTVGVDPALPPKEIKHYRRRRSSTTSSGEEDQRWSRSNITTEGEPAPPQAEKKISTTEHSYSALTAGGEEDPATLNSTLPP